LQLGPAQLVSQLAEMDSRFEDDIPQGTADAVTESLVREVVVVMIALHVYKGP